MGLPIRLVLLRPHYAENLGAAARALSNFGASDWVWVDPAVDDLGPARRLAVHATDLLAAARVAPSLDAAVADCVWVVGTSSRRVAGKRRLNARQTAREALERASQGPVGLVFGDERNGLTNAEVERCHALSGVPTCDEQPSLNLAQAVLLYSYELRMAQLEAAPRPPGPAPVAASHLDLEHLEAVLRTVLARSRFLVQDNRHAMRDLLAPLVRARLSRQEARLWTTALFAVARRLPGWS